MDLSAENIREKIKEILSYKVAKEGLHVDAITTAIINLGNTLFDETPDKDMAKSKINQVLYRESLRKEGIVRRVRNQKTGAYRKGVYKLVKRAR